MGIVGFHIEVEKVFSILGICTNLWCSHLGMDNLEMFVTIYKNWFDDACVGGFPSSMEILKILMDENEDVITSVKALDMDENNYRV